MSKWVSVKDRLPEELTSIKFLHNGYEFTGVCIHKPYPYQGVFSKRKYPSWFFMGTHAGKSSVTTVEVTAWMPLEAPQQEK